MPTRIQQYSEVSTALALHSDRRLAEVVDGAVVLGAGIGGASKRLDVAGVPVFVKRVPLTDVERRPEHVASTANTFGLPPECQYGIGGPGFGAWRELAAAIMTTGWVLSGRSEAFPLLYHWRVLPGAAPLADDLADVAASVDFWHGSAAVRDRIAALAGAAASLVLFFEHVPSELRAWLRDGHRETAVSMLERHIADVAAMNAAGLFHFDLHYANLLTDGDRVFIGDLGLATSPRFDLSAPERDFLARHGSHDVAYAMTHLVNWFAVAAYGFVPPAEGGPVERNAFIRRVAAGEPVPPGARPEVAAVVTRYAPVAALVNDLYWNLFGVSRHTAYPAEAIEAVLAPLSGG